MKPIILSKPINAFPDSGHHLTFVPLLAYNPNNADFVHERLGITEQVGAIPNPIQKYLRSMADNAAAIENNLIKAPNSPGQKAPQNAIPWVRAWVGTQERILPGTSSEFVAKEKLVGIWIAVESNLGTRSRGYITRTSSPPVQTEVDQYNAEKEIETPYAYQSLADTHGPNSQFSVHVPSGVEDGQCEELLQFTVNWLRPDGEKPIVVDLLVDFGNTRTAVLALEHIADSPSFATICKPIPFQSNDSTFEGFSGFNFDETAVLTDSWFLLKQPPFEGIASMAEEVPEWTFAVHEEARFMRRPVAVRRLDKVTYRIPHMFVEMSPALMGPSARKELLRLNLEYGAKYFLSSPKRYAWDTDPADEQGAQNWHMVPHDASRLAGDVSELPNLECQLLRFMFANGADWKLEEPPTTRPAQQRPVRNPMNPKYPRSDTLAWTALSVLENAYRTINSEAWRVGNRPLGARKLRKVVVTYPSGWTAGEIEAYRRKWQKAINVFMLTRLESPKPSDVQLVMALDEAVASQLPIVVSEIRRLGNDGHRWLQAVGLGKGTDSRVRAMTIDIGGGTTDISIVEYEDRIEGAGTDLRASVLFKDSSTIAGDQLRKMVIERVLLPLVLGCRGQLDREVFTGFLSGVQNNFAAYAKWSRYTRILFLPIVNRWLSDLASNSSTPFTISDLFYSSEDRQVLESFNDESTKAIGVALIDPGEQLTTSHFAAHLESCINDCFDRTFRALAKHVAAFACDLVIVSGKPSELPPIRRLLEELLPIMPNRLLFAKGYRAGASNWPLSSDGRVHDAKFVTVVGAALCQAIQSSLIKGWGLKVIQDKRMLSQNWWGVPDDNRLRPVILDSSASENTVKVQIGRAIARKLLPGDSSPEPVYILRWRDKSRRNGRSPVVDVTFRRVPAKEAGAGESLEIIRAKGVFEEEMPDGRTRQTPISEQDIELKLCTMPQGEHHWLDTGRFEVVWPEVQV